MKTPTLLALAAAFPSFLLAGAPSAPDGKVPADAVQIPTDVSRWSIGAGVQFRQIKGDFSISSPGPLTPGLPRGSSSGGDPGFFTGGSGTVQYADGSVGPQFGSSNNNTADGTAYQTINSPSQLSNSRTSTGVPFQVVDETFHSSLSQTSYSDIYSGRSFHSSDEKTGVGPYVELRYALFQNAHLDVNLVLGYSWVRANLGSGNGLLATESIAQNRNNTQFSYTYASNADITGLTQPGTTFPNSGVSSGTIFDAATYNSFYGGNEPNPHKSSSSSQSSNVIAAYRATGSAQLTVNLHEIVLAPEVNLRLADRVHLGLLVGPTLNFINSDLDATAAWYGPGGGSPLKAYHASDSETKVKLGVAAQVALQYDLTKKLFLQAAGSFRYVPGSEVTAGFAKANVDVSSFQGSVGLGYRF